MIFDSYTYHFINQHRWIITWTPSPLNKIETLPTIASKETEHFGPKRVNIISCRVLWRSGNWGDEGTSIFIEDLTESPHRRSSLRREHPDRVYWWVEVKIAANKGFSAKEARSAVITESLQSETFDQFQPETAIQNKHWIIYSQDYF